MAIALFFFPADIGSRSLFDEDSDRFRESVRKFMREELAPMQSKFEEEGRPTKEIWRRLGEQVGSGIKSVQSDAYRSLETHNDAMPYSIL